MALQYSVLSKRYKELKKEHINLQYDYEKEHKEKNKLIREKKQLINYLEREFEIAGEFLKETDDEKEILQLFIQRDLYRKMLKKLKKS